MPQPKSQDEAKQAETQSAAKRQAAVERLRAYRGWLPDDFKFDRDEANAR